MTGALGQSRVMGDTFCSAVNWSEVCEIVMFASWVDIVS